MEPDYSHLPKQEYEQTRTVYGNVKEEIPKDIPKPLGRRVITLHSWMATYSMILKQENQSQLYCSLSTPPHQTSS